MKHTLPLLWLLAASLLTLLASPAPSARADDFWGPIPPVCQPQEIGRRIAANLRKRDFFTGKSGLKYPEVCTAYGALRFAAATKDQALLDQLVARYSKVLTPEGQKLIPPTGHVDRNVFGILPLEIYRQIHDPRYLELGQKIADQQWSQPDAAGLSDQTRWWIDDMFMIGSLQIQAWRATNDKKYADRVATEMVAYLAKLQQPNGLFHHGPEFPFFWGRGNGWVAASLSELLLSLPPEQPQRPALLAGYKKMMAALLQNQAPDGMWRQLIDKPESWPETSCTGMFTFAFAIGVREGWLDAAAYKEPARKAWIALCSNLDENGDIREVCVGTSQKNDIQYYLDRPRKAGDLHGQAAVIWAAWAMAR